jgi:hypothetical protein
MGLAKALAALTARREIAIATPFMEKPPNKDARNHASLPDSRTSDVT